MKAVFTKAALAVLEQLLAYTSQNYPARLPAVQKRLRDVIARIEAWPQSARAVAQRPGVRVAPLLRFPYRVFYSIGPERIEILHIHHTARGPWTD